MTFDTVPGWGLRPDGASALGPTHGAVVIDTFSPIRADWDALESLDPTQPLKAYLYRMARNRAYRHLRDERLHAEKHVLLMHRAEARGPETGWLDAGPDAEQLRLRLHAWIDELPDRQREALVLSRFHELSHREVAAVMGVSPRTVNNHIMRALEHLQGRIQAFEPTLLAK